MYTLPEINIIASENGWLEYLFPCGMAYFLSDLLVSGGVYPSCFPNRWRIMKHLAPIAYSGSVSRTLSMS